MKLAKRIGLSFLILLALTSVGGYFYFKAKFKPAANQLKLAAVPASIPITWFSTNTNPHAALLVPVTLPNCPKTFYLQFDTGAPSTLFYKGKLEAIQKQGYPLPVRQADDQLLLEGISFQIGELPVTAQEVKVLAFGDSTIQWEDTSALEIIGTLGTDFLEEKVISLDYQHMVLSVSNQLPANAPATSFQDFSFDSRRILLPSRINGKETQLLFDTGSSTYELLTNKTTWQDLAQPGETIDTAQTSNWGKILTAYTTTTSGTAAFGPVQLPLKKATYIEGMGFINTTFMRFSGLDGMTGNKLFMNHTLVLDMKRQKFAVLQ